MSTVISVENLSKSYRLGTIGGGTLREDVARWTAKLRRKPDPTLKIGQEHHARLVGKEFWALQDVSFKVKAGEILGIIGRNGAGKSTLLKILSRVTAPSSGHIKIKGRIASLLEVGTGFHPELTGRENVFLNGTILGMTKAEIRKKFDEIVAFSEIEEFIDTPVKRYSSGMYVRLAFAVAAHLEPEILIVDEVLAVGDVQFQDKCLGKMRDVSRSGRTILFVSHNMQAVTLLCKKAAWLKGGLLVEMGAAREIVTSYLDSQGTEKENEAVPLSQKARTGTGSARFTGVTVTNVTRSLQNGAPLMSGDTLDFHLDIEAYRSVTNCNVALTIYDSSAYRLVDVNTALKGQFVSMMSGERLRVTFTIQDLLLKPGRYTVELWLGKGGLEDIDFVKNAKALTIRPDVAAAEHTESFPGTYQCRFTHRIIKCAN